MKVAVSMTLDVDSAAWRAEFDVPPNQEIREDVREYVAMVVSSALKARGVLHLPEPEPIDEVPTAFDVNIAAADAELAELAEALADDGDVEADAAAIAEALSDAEVELSAAVALADAEALADGDAEADVDAVKV